MTIAGGPTPSFPIYQQQVVNFEPAQYVPGPELSAFSSFLKDFNPILGGIDKIIQRNIEKKKQQAERDRKKAEDDARRNWYITGGSAPSQATAETQTSLEPRAEPTYKIDKSSPWVNTSVEPPTEETVMTERVSTMLKGQSTTYSSPFVVTTWGLQQADLLNALKQGKADRIGTVFISELDMTRQEDRFKVAEQFYIPENIAELMSADQLQAAREEVTLRIGEALNYLDKQQELQSRSVISDGWKAHETKGWQNVLTPGMELAAQADDAESLKLWMSLPDDMKEAASLQTFKSAVEQASILQNSGHDSLDTLHRLFTSHQPVWRGQSLWQIAQDAKLEYDEALGMITKASNDYVQGQSARDEANLVGGVEQASGHLDMLIATTGLSTDNPEEMREAIKSTVHDERIISPEMATEQEREDMEDRLVSKYISTDDDKAESYHIIHKLNMGEMSPEEARQYADQSNWSYQDKARVSGKADEKEQSQNDLLTRSHMPDIRRRMREITSMLIDKATIGTDFRGTPQYRLPPSFTNPIERKVNLLLMDVEALSKAGDYEGADRLIENFLIEEGINDNLKQDSGSTTDDLPGGGTTTTGGTTTPPGGGNTTPGGNKKDDKTNEDGTDSTIVPAPVQTVTPQAPSLSSAEIDRRKKEFKGGQMTISADDVKRVLVEAPDRTFTEKTLAQAAKIYGKDMTAEEFLEYVGVIQTMYASEMR